MKEQYHLGKHFDVIAEHYAKHHIVQTEHLERLIERFRYIKGDFPCILDLGCGPGDSSLKLKKIFPKSRLIAIDFSKKMLTLTKSKRPFFNGFECVQANVSVLPLPDESVDLIFAHHVLAYLPNMNISFAEWHRVLKPGGGLMLSSFGPDTYKEVRMAYAEIDKNQHVHNFSDLHDIGDALMQQGFVDPVIDRADLTLRFPSNQDLLMHLKAQGGLIDRQGMRKGLMTPRQYQKMLLALAPTLTHELITAHAWRGKIKRKNGEQVISLAELKVKLRDSHL